MTLSVPPAVNYQSPLIAVPTRWDQAPIEGSKIIPCEVDWGTMGGTSNCVSFNLQNNATLNFSQIVALSIDNSACGADIEFIFPDTTETLSIPAYAPKTIVPVFTNQTQFWLSSPNAQSEDITRFAILNSMPPPIAVPTTQEQNSAVNVNVPATAAGDAVIVASTINGTLENAFIFLFGSGGVTGISAWTLKDGNNNIIAGGQLVSVQNGVIAVAVLELTDIRVRFQNGLKINIASATLGAGSILAVNLYYRTP